MLPRMNIVIAILMLLIKGWMLMANLGAMELAGFTDHDLQIIEKNQDSYDAVKRNIKSLRYRMLARILNGDYGDMAMRICLMM